MSLKDIMNVREVHTVNFGERVDKTPLTSKGGETFKTYGYRPDQGDIPIEYLARISSFRHNCTIVGVIQEDITTSVESQWDYIVDPGKFATADFAAQALTGSISMVTKSTSRRKWTTTTPMTMSLKMRFEAIVDAQTDVVSPMRLLQKIACPSENALIILGGGPARKLGNLPLLSPPGPTPFTLRGLGIAGVGPELTSYAGVTSKSLRGGDMIMVEIGRLLTFHNVIASRVDNIHENKYDENGNCISGTVNFTFQTYEMATAEAIEKSYMKHTPKTATIYPKNAKR